MYLGYGNDSFPERSQYKFRKEKEPCGRVLRNLKEEGYAIHREDVAILSPYLTRHIKRFGDYYIDIENKPPPLDSDIAIPIYLE